MSSFARSFGLSIVNNSSVWQSGDIVREEAAQFGWGRYDADLENRVTGRSRIEISFSFHYFKHLGAEYFRKIFRFSEEVLRSATSTINEINSECWVGTDVGF